MLHSSNQNLGEYDLIRQPDHISNWDHFVESEVQPDGKTGHALTHLFGRAVHDYEKEAQKYRCFFDLEAFDEYHDDPNAFQQALSLDVPVIANTLRNRRAELREWQRNFRLARGNDLLVVFENVLDFQREWQEANPIDHYIQQAFASEPSGFKLDPLDYSPTMNIPNVIGMGIKSIVLFHLDPERFPPRGRSGPYGLYFLSEMQDFGLPSRSSEFLMVNDTNPTPDGSMIMDHNYWYPYGLFSLYSLRVYNWIEARSQEAGITLDPGRRFVYSERFFNSVCDQHKADLRTMRAHERFEVPW